MDTCQDPPRSGASRLGSMMRRPLSFSLSLSASSPPPPSPVTRSEPLAGDLESHPFGDHGEAAPGGGEARSPAAVPGRPRSRCRASNGQAERSYTGDINTWAEREIGIQPNFLNMHRILTRPKPIGRGGSALSIGFGLVKIRCILRKLGWIPIFLSAQVFMSPV